MQNLYFGFFIFWKLTELCYFVTYLWDDPRTLCLYAAAADDDDVVGCYKGLMHAVLGYYKWLIDLLWQVVARGLMERGNAGAIVSRHNV